MWKKERQKSANENAQRKKGKQNLNHNRGLDGSRVCESEDVDSTRQNRRSKPDGFRHKKFASNPAVLPNLPSVREIEGQGNPDG
jgi:hypothetical protein